MELEPRLFMSTVYDNMLCPTASKWRNPRRVLQEPHQNWEAPQIDHFETPGNTVPLPVHRENQDVAQDFPDDTEVLPVQPEHVEIPQGNGTDDQQHTEEERRYPEWIRRPPDRYH
eukprot:Em0009g847a